MSQPKIKKEDRCEYLKLIFFILKNIRDIEGVKRIYQYAQRVWFDEVNGTSPGG